jgi:hypothetical protein
MCIMCFLIKKVKITKKDRILAFMRFLIANYAEPVMEGSSQMCLSLFHNQDSVFSFFLNGFSDGIQGNLPKLISILLGDFDGLVKLNFASPPSIEYFKEIWRDYFHNVLTESERPQCVECSQYDSKIKKAISDKDSSLVNSIKELKHNHLKNAKSLAECAKNLELQTLLYPTCLSFVIDNMATRYIPKLFKETSSSWSLEKLGIHAGL